MIDGQANATGTAITDRRERGTGQGAVRRRRSRPRSVGRWVVARSRKRIIRTAVLCTGVLLLMAVGLYFGLSRQESAPSEGARIVVTASRALV